jgi:hypothetical protein
MKKHILYLLLAANIFLVGLVLTSFVPQHKNISYQHLIIIGWKLDLHHVFISIDGKNYENTKSLNKEVKGDWDMNPLINLVHQYESEGWELQSFNTNGEFHSFWLRRQK